MLFLDVIADPIRHHHRVIPDTVYSFSDSLRIAEEGGVPTGGSPLMNWTIPALLAALAATLMFVFLFKRQQAAKVRPLE